MAYLIFAFVLAAVLIGWRSLRSRSTSDAAKSVESFRRAMRALTPERAGRVKRR